MSNIVDGSSAGDMIVDNLRANVSLYNRYLILVSSILFSIVFFKGVETGQEGVLYSNASLRICLISILISILSTIIEVGVLIIKDQAKLGIICVWSKEWDNAYSTVIAILIFVGFFSFIIGVGSLIYFVWNL